MVTFVRIKLRKNEEQENHKRKYEIKTQKHFNFHNTFFYIFFK
jgi:hypothetical protein